MLYGLSWVDYPGLIVSNGLSWTDYPERIILDGLSWVDYRDGLSCIENGPGPRTGQGWQVFPESQLWSRGSDFLWSETPSSSSSHLETITPQCGVRCGSCPLWRTLKSSITVSSRWKSILVTYQKRVSISWKRSAAFVVTLMKEIRKPWFKH